MKRKIYAVILLISVIRLIPHIILFNIHTKKNIIKYDVERWSKWQSIMGNTQYCFIYLMTYYPEFRNLFYYRIGWVCYLINWLCPKMNTLYLHVDEIGPGLIIQHGFATFVRAKSIGKDCWINQQVTIDKTNGTDAPTLGDHVMVRAGAIVVGNVHLGNHSQVGINSVVLEDVPEKCTVFGIPARVVYVEKT